MEHGFHKVHFILVEGTRIGSNSYGLLVQSPFYALMVR